MTAEYVEEKAAFSMLNDVAGKVRSQGRYVNRLSELTGAVKNGDQCGKFEKRNSYIIYFLSDNLIQNFN